MTYERLGTSVFTVVIVQFGLRFKAFCANVANKFAIARMKFCMPFKKSYFLKTFVAALEVTDKALGRFGIG